MRFMFDGNHINPNSTVQALELEEGDVIECMQEQVKPGRSMYQCDHYRRFSERLVVEQLELFCLVRLLQPLELIFHAVYSL